MQDFVHQPCGRCIEGFKPQLQPEPFTVISLGFIAFRGLGFQANLGGREGETEKESERERERRLTSPAAGVQWSLVEVLMTVFAPSPPNQPV